MPDGYVAVLAAQVAAEIQFERTTQGEALIRQICLDAVAERAIPNRWDRRAVHVTLPRPRPSRLP